MSQHDTEDDAGQRVFDPVKQLLDNLDKERLLKAVFLDASGEGPTLLAQAVAQVIRAYQVPAHGPSYSWARKVLRRVTREQGEKRQDFKPRMAVDRRRTIAYATDKRTIAKLAPGEHQDLWFEPPTFKLFSLPEYGREAPNRSTVDRTCAIAAQELALEEDLTVRMMLDAVTEPVEIPDFTLPSLEKLRYKVERERYVVTQMHFNRADVGRVLIECKDYLDPINDRELLRRGIWGRLLGATLTTVSAIGLEEVVPPGHVYMTTDPAYLGELWENCTVFGEAFIRSDKPFDFNDPVKTIKDWLAHERQRKQEGTHGAAVCELLHMAIGSDLAVSRGVLKKA